VTWGDKNCGGDSSTVQEALRGVEIIYSTNSAFAAVLKDGTVVTWGYGGDSITVQKALRGVEIIYTTSGAFAAVLKDFASEEEEKDSGAILTVAALTEETQVIASDLKKKEQENRELNLRLEALHLQKQRDDEEMSRQLQRLDVQQEKKERENGELILRLEALHLQKQAAERRIEDLSRQLAALTEETQVEASDLNIDTNPEEAENNEEPSEVNNRVDQDEEKNDLQVDSRATQEEENHERIVTRRVRVDSLIAIIDLADEVHREVNKQKQTVHEWRKRFCFFYGGWDSGMFGMMSILLSLIAVVLGNVGESQKAWMS